MENNQPPSKAEPIPVQFLTPYQQYSPENEINLAELWRILVKRKHIIIAAMAICFALSVIYLVITDKTQKERNR